MNSASGCSFHERDHVVFVALHHRVERARRLLEALVQVPEVEVLDDALHRELRRVAPVPRDCRGAQ